MVNTQLTIFGGFAPNSSSAETLSKAMGNQTVMSGSVNRSTDHPSQSLQMIQRPLMSPDELKSLPKGQFIVMKTGFYPMKVQLKLFLDWGIRFQMPFSVPEHGSRVVAYASKEKLRNAILNKYPAQKTTSTPPVSSMKKLKTGPAPIGEVICNEST